MRRILIPALLSGLLSMAAVAQYGTAPNNYYPDKYNGSTFTGTVTETEADQITLTYTKGSKTETFIGKFEAGCSVPRADKSDHRMSASEIPKGTVITAFFNTNTRKVDGKKSKENLILAIAFNVWQGRAISEEKKMIWPCTTDIHLTFQVR